MPPTDAPTTTTAAPTTAVPGSDPTSTTTVAGAPTTTTAVPIVDPNDPAAPGQQEVLPVRGDTGEVCIVGPSGGTGEVFERGSAEPSLDQVGAWGVTVNLRSDGEAAWNLLASQCNQGASSCPSRQLAIVLDDIIQSAPVVNEPFFSGSVQITGSFSEGEARSLARVLNRGAFPVNVEAQSVQTVSPTLGGDSLEAAVISGIVGVIVIVLFMIAYYRKLAIVIMNGRKWWTSGAMDQRCRIAIVMGVPVPNAPPHQRQSMILVPMDSKGVTVKRALTVYGYDDAPHGHAEVIFDNVRVPAGKMPLGEGRGFEIAQGRRGRDAFITACA